MVCGNDAEVAVAVPVPMPQTLGARLRSRRKASGLTLQQVAKGAGLTAGFVSLVERDLATPSIASVAAIAEVLGATMGAFLDTPPAPALTTRAAARQEFAVARGGLRYERLSDAFPGSGLRSVLIHEPPGHRSEPVSHDGEELIYVLSGELTVELDGAATVLGPGDSIHFSSRRVHAAWNAGMVEARALWCGTMDIFGEGDGGGPLLRPVT